MRRKRALRGPHLHAGRELAGELLALELSEPIGVRASRAVACPSPPQAARALHAHDWRS